MKNSLNFWMSLNRTTIHEHRQRMIDRMWALDEQGAMENYGEGRGIVMQAGNADTLQRAIYTLRMLRKRASPLCNARRPLPPDLCLLSEPPLTEDFARDPR
jgi:alpha 1,2-mannosyltransferase